MPTYEYECQKCGHFFELFQSISAEPRKRCPKCQGKVKRLFGTGAGIIFKGSGFYTTDYRSENYKKGQKAESKGESKGESKSDSKSASESGKSEKSKKSSSDSSSSSSRESKS